MIRNKGGLIIHIDRESADQEFDAHVSESSIIRHHDDAVVDNDGSVDAFLRVVCAVVTRHVSA